MAGVDTSRFQEVKELPRLEYGDATYWTLRYKEKSTEPFDWYLKWEQLKETLTPWLSAESEVLMLGCGTSLIPEQMVSEGLASSIVCVDQCAELIEALSEKYKDKEEAFHFEALDAAQLPVTDWADRFDVVMDKAMLDAILSGRQGRPKAEEVLKAALAVLKQSGRYVCISHARPGQRLPLLHSVADGDQWEVSTIPRPLDAAPEPKKGAKAPKGGPDPSAMQVSAVASAEDHVYYVYCCQKPSLPDPVEGVEGEAGSAEGSGSAAGSATGEEAPAE